MPYNNSPYKVITDNTDKENPPTEETILTTDSTPKSKVIKNSSVNGK